MKSNDLTIPGTKFSTRLQYEVNSLLNYTWSPRPVPYDMIPVPRTSLRAPPSGIPPLRGGIVRNVVCRGEGGGEGVDPSIVSVRFR